MGDLVSILMSTYNGERFLPAQMESILGQTHGGFELLIIDDGSADATPEILAEFAARDRRIKLFPSDCNLGQKQQLANLLRQAEGAYISVSDQDDIWARDKTARLLAGIGDAALAFGRSELVDEEGRSLGQSLLASLGADPAPDDRLIALFQPAVSGHAMLARREVVTDTAFRRAHAYDWLIGLDAVFSSGWRYVDEAIVEHRIHAANQSNGGNIRNSGAKQQMGLPERLLHKVASFSHASKWHRMRRRKFIQRLEHLSFSPIVPVAIQRVSARLWEACTNSWYRGEAIVPADDRPLRSLLSDLLKPYAGSEQDWQRSVREIRRLT